MLEVHEKLLNTAQAEILSEKSLRYKRNALVLGIVIIGGNILGVQFHDLSIFGAKLPGDQRNVAIWVIWIAYIYNLGMYAVYGLGDWQNWTDNLTKKWPEGDDKQRFFPELRMYWRLNPTQDETINRLYSSQKRSAMLGWNGFRADENDQLLICESKFKANEPEGWSPTSAFNVPLVLENTVRRSVVRSAIFELGIPTLVFLFAVLASCGLLPNVSLNS